MFRLLARRALERELRSHSGLIGVGTMEELITCKFLGFDRKTVRLKIERLRDKLILR